MFAFGFPSAAVDMFGLNIGVAEKILRPIIVYLFILICLRVFGKRQLAQLNPFDLVVLLSISNTVQNAIIGNDNSVTGGLIGALTLFAVNYVVVRFVLRHRSLDQLLEGKPTVLIEDGLIRRDRLAKELLSEPELLVVAHRQGFSTLEEIEHCELEPGGVFYIRAKAAAREPKPSEILAKLEQLSRQIDDLRPGSAAL
jgi:uncharacterized membrane protein YcaP (DUF421 family)